MNHPEDKPTALSLSGSSLKRLWGGDTGRTISISVLIGLVSGLGALLYFFLLEWGTWYFMGQLAGAPTPSPAGEGLHMAGAAAPYRPWLVVLLPALGGLVSGLLVYTFAPEAEGHGVDAMIDAFHNLKGHIRGRVPFIKTISSLAVLSTGGSAGREGPIAQIGAGFGSWVSRVLKLGARERRIFMLAGCAAGLGAIFRAPLGAAITSVEVLYSEDFESEAIIPCVISSVTAYSIFTFFFGFDPIFATPRLIVKDPRELVAYAMLGLICAMVGRIYVPCFFATRAWFRRLSLPRIVRPALGGLGVGLIGLVSPQALGPGFGYLQEAMNGNLGILVMVVAAGAKILATSLTIGSGGSGGVFGPTLFIGGMLGGVVGHWGHQLMPELIGQPGGYVLVGMAAFFAGSAKAPLGALLMVAEMTWSYGLLPPLMLVSVMAILISRHRSIYEKQLVNKFSSPAHASDMTVNVLDGLSVSQAFKPRPEFTVLKADTRFADLQRIVADTRQTVFPVVDAPGNLVGLVSVRDIRVVLCEESVRDLLVCGELCTTPRSVRPEQDLYSALLTFLETGLGQIPVVETRKDGGQGILGMLDHEDVIAAYRDEVHRRKQSAA